VDRQHALFLHPGRGDEYFIPTILQSDFGGNRVWKERKEAHPTRMLIPPPVPVTHPSLKRYSTSFIHIFGDTDLVKVATQLGDEICRLLQFLFKNEFKRKRISYMERVV
jgi:hypothetical protein